MRLWLARRTWARATGTGRGFRPSCFLCGNLFITWLDLINNIALQHVSFGRPHDSLIGLTAAPPCEASWLSPLCQLTVSSSFLPEPAEGGTRRPATVAEDGAQTADGPRPQRPRPLLHVRGQHALRDQGGWSAAISPSSQDYVDTTGNIMVDIADGIGMVSQVREVRRGRLSRVSRLSSITSTPRESQRLRISPPGPSYQEIQALLRLL